MEEDDTQFSFYVPYRPYWPVRHAGNGDIRTHVSTFSLKVVGGLPHLRGQRPLPLHKDVSHRVQVVVLRVRLALYAEGTWARCGLAGDVTVVFLLVCNPVDPLL